ncbi:HNH endonuclease [Streptomyces xiamenensis]
MPRIRTVKPEFWEDEVVGLLPRDARLLFISTFNMADDEGLLRWTPAYIKASTFMYDDDLTIPDVGKLMTMLTDAGLLFPYIGGVARQQMACVVNFRKHQRVNRPQKSKLPPPSLQNNEVRRMYARRDGWICQLCGGDIPQLPVANDSHNLSIDHIRPQSAGGSDHPSNVRATHQACNKGRRNSPEGEFVPPSSLAGLNDSVSDALIRSGNGSLNGSLSDSVNESQRGVTAPPPLSTESHISSVNDSVNDSLNRSLPEGKGREGKGREGNPPYPPADAPSGPPAVAAPEKGLTDQIFDAWWEKYGRGTAQGRKSVRQAVSDALTNEIDPHELWSALTQIGELSKPVTGGTLQFALAQIRKPSNVIEMPRHQKQSDDAFDRAMARARARTQQQQKEIES